MKKRGLRLWQFIMLLIPLVALPVIMCFPFYSLNKNVAKDTMQDVVQSIKEDLQDSSSEYKDQLLDSFDENLSTDKLEEALDNSLNGMDYDELLRQSEKVWGVNLSSVSGWNLLNLKVDFSVDKLLDLLNEDGNSDSLTQFIVNSVASSIEDKMNGTFSGAAYHIDYVFGVHRDDRIACTQLHSEVEQIYCDTGNCILRRYRDLFCHAGDVECPGKYRSIGK